MTHGHTRRHAHTRSNFKKTVLNSNASNKLRAYVCNGDLKSFKPGSQARGKMAHT